ncbi:hypothetical protein VBM90_00855 [Mycoplasma sp. 2704]|uniref:hypothetical protein n=1 Tax=Mycoplasma sp. 2704 TaxID=3108529 RepID=UPI002B1E00D2|nr:hypothetical protein [Mycoplasma sp. 2704]MEA4134357.1 hypothetical protein [Mycoplasma sp. 2704]
MKQQNLLRKLKAWSAIIIIALVSIFTFTLVGVKMSNRFKPSFFNYKSYISDENRDKIQENFSYKTFDEINEFTVALVNSKAIAGIGSDFQAVNLIKKNLLAPIDFKKLLNLSDKPDKELLKNILQTIYTPIVFEHLASYDEDLKTDQSGKKYEEPRHLWEYFVPYFMQDAVVAFNTKKQKQTNGAQPITKELLDQNKTKLQANGTNLEEFGSLSLYNQLNTLFNNGYSNLTITDAVRANMLYGSFYDFKPTGVVLNTNNDVTKDNYTKFIDNFYSLVQKGTGKNPNDSKYITYDGDGQGILNKLINPQYPEADSAVMYNGDALDAYFSDNNYEEVENGTVQSFKIAQNILLIDGLVVAKNTSQGTLNELYETLNSSIYSNMGELYRFTKQFKNDIQEGLNNYSLKMYDEYIDLVFRDYYTDLNKYNDFKSQLHELYKATLIDINTLSSYKAKVEELFSIQETKNVFVRLIQDLNNKDPENAVDINDEDEFKKKIEFIVNHIDFANSKFVKIMNKKYLQLNNFDFVNYTPPTRFEYELVKRNYFITDDNELDNSALYIYQIENDPNEKVTHTKINGVDDNLSSKIGIAYNQKFKS